MPPADYHGDMPHQPNRRDVLKWTAGTAAAAALGPAAHGADNPPPPASPPARKVLFFTKSAGFQHDVVNRRGKPLAFAERTLIDLAKPANLAVTATKDGSVFTKDGLAGYDAVVFYTTGDLTQAGTDGQPPLPAGGKQALLDLVAGGKGFVGLHCATDTFHSHGKEIDPYIQMLGGEFVAHGNQQLATSRAVDPKFPGAPAADVTFAEEWYAMSHFAPDLHVILAQQTHGMAGAMYQRPPYPSTWAKPHGTGRVFYTSMGHREDVWQRPTFAALLLGGLAWAIGDKPNVDVTPNAATIGT